MELFYRIAGLQFRVLIPDGYEPMQEGILENFRAEDSLQPDQIIGFEIVDELSEPQGDCIFSHMAQAIYSDGESRVRYDGTTLGNWSTAYMRLHKTGSHTVAQVKRNVVASRVEDSVITRAMELESMVTQNSGVILHSAFIEFNGKAVLFTAPSGTGKSTQAELWKRYRETPLINGDQSIIQVRNDDIWACGLPYSGSSPVHENREFPLAAIVYLSQAKKNNVSKLRGAKAFRSVWEGCSINVWNEEDISAASKTVSDIVSRVPVLYLECTPDKSAVLVLENELKRLKLV